MTTPSPDEQTEPSEHHDFLHDLHDTLNDHLTPTQHEQSVEDEILHPTDYDDLDQNLNTRIHKGLGY